jgi:addiction module RelE/StbE family toxin
MDEVTKIIWTNKSKNDLKAIFDFLSDTINREKASEIIKKIIPKVEIIYKAPFTGQKEPKFIFLKKEYRRIIISHYKIVYHISHNTAFINCVFDSRQNPIKLKLK